MALMRFPRLGKSSVTSFQGMEKLTKAGCHSQPNFVGIRSEAVKESGFDTGARWAAKKRCLLE